MILFIPHTIPHTMKQLLSLLLAAILPALTLQAASSGLSPLIQNIPGRHIQSLDGHWKYLLDVYELGYYNYRMAEDPNGWFKDQKAAAPEDLVEYNFDTAPTLHVPGDWNTQEEELFNYEGNIWYRRQFEVRLDGARKFLHFGAVNYLCSVYLNGRKAAVHEGGFSPFDIEVTNLLQDGVNTLILKVDNRRLTEGVPTVNTDWYNYGGITRPVSLVAVPQTFVRDYFIQLGKGQTDVIEGWVQLDGTLRDAVTVEIPELKLSVQVPVNDAGYGTFSVKCARLVRWSPEQPKLYRVRVACGEDEVFDEIGFRTIETRGKKLYLNGKELFCRGVSLHEEAPFRSGRAWSREDAMVLLGWAKEMNCNFVRLAHYQHNEQMIREAERQGLLLWTEIPCYWTIQWENEATYANAAAQLETLIGRDKNRANIIIWSVANETPVSAPRTAFLTRLVDRAHALDPTRLVAAAMEKKELPGGIMTLDDPMADRLDVLSFNQYVGWYDGLPEKCDRVQWQFTQDKPVFISEFGGGALQGYHGPANQRFTEEFQEDLYRRSVEMLEKMDGLSGCTPWILTDFRSPRRVLTDIQDGFNRKGLISDKGIRKAAFYVMQQWYAAQQAAQR